jgi:AcrR family transcriptional regulator
MSPDAVRPPPTEAKARTRLDPQVRREQIIDATIAVLLEVEPAEVTFEQVATRAGVSRALVYNYFGDKSGLMAAVYLRSVEQLDHQLDQTFRDHAGTTTGAEQMRRVVRTYLEFAEANGAAWRLLGSADAVLHPVVLKNRRDRYDLMARSWGGNPEARMLARGIVGLLEASSLDWLETPEVDLDRATDVIEALVWSGLSSLERFGISVPTA